MQFHISQNPQRISVIVICYHDLQCITSIKRYLILSTPTRRSKKSWHSLIHWAMMAYKLPDWTCQYLKKNQTAHRSPECLYLKDVIPDFQHVINLLFLLYAVTAKSSGRKNKSAFLMLCKRWIFGLWNSSVNSYMTFSMSISLNHLFFHLLWEKANIKQMLFVSVCDMVCFCFLLMGDWQLACFHVKKHAGDANGIILQSNQLP